MCKGEGEIFFWGGEVAFSLQVLVVVLKLKFIIIS